MSAYFRRLLSGIWDNGDANDNTSGLLAKKSLLIFLLQAFALLLAFLSNFVFVKLAGVGGYGAYVALFNLFYVLVPFCTLGTETLLIKKVAVYDQSGKHAQLAGLLLFVIFTIVTATAAVSGLTGSVGNAGTFIQSKTTINWIALLIVSLAMLSITSVGQSSLQGLSKTTSSQLAEKLVRPLVLLSLPLAIYVSQNEVTTNHLVITNLCGIAFGMILVVILNFRAFKNKISKSKPVFESKEWWQTTLMFFLISLLYMVNTRIDIFLLGIFRGNDQVGTYSIALRISELISQPLGIVNIVLAPLVVKLFESEQREQLQRLLTRTARFLMIAGIPVFIAILLTGKMLLPFLGIHSTDAFIALLILSIAQLVNITAGSVGIILLMTGNHRYSIFSLLTGTLINIVLNLILVPHFGFLGTAISTGTGLIVWNLLMYYFVRTKLNLRTTAFKQF